MDFRQSVLKFLCMPIIFVFTLSFSFAQTDVFQKQVSLDRQSSSIYSLLNQISGQTGYFFVYNTEVLDSDRRIRIRAGNRTLSSWLEEIVSDPSLDFHTIENHILIFRPEEIPGSGNGNIMPDLTENNEFIIRGRVLDESSRNPLPFATVAIYGKSLGITTNSDGLFTMKLTDELVEDYLSVSYIGYKSHKIPVKLFIQDKLDVLMEVDHIAIEEVMIHYYDPLTIIESARNRINKNFSNKPVYMLNFYREGVMRSNRFINYSEALFQVYKSPHTRIFERDQVKLLQSRNISNTDRTDTLVLKIRAGIRSSLDLDFIKNIPDFLNEEYMHEYDFTYDGIVAIDGKLSYAVAFEQKKNITEPFYTGVIYIDLESFAFLGADFEVHPKFIDKAIDQFVRGRNRDFRASVDRAAYSVRYRYYDGVYYLNHVRADLNLRYRKRFSIFSNNFSVFVEMATTHIDTDNAQRFERRDAMRTDRVFFDENHSYDPEFWSDYSFIAPEKHITNAIALIEAKIESYVEDR